MSDLDIEDIKEIAKKAGNAILEIYEKDFEIEYKEDTSPLTEADKASNDIINKGLNQLYPEIPILSEEGGEIPYETRKNWSKFFLIDPLDGTKEFIKRNDQFTVNIALIQDNQPIVGVVYAPALDTIYWGEVDKGAWKEDKEGVVELGLKKVLGTTLRVVASASHFTKETKTYIEKWANGKKYEIINSGSSLKLCHVAEDKANIYPRLGPTMEWDTAAAHAIVKASGKNVVEYETEKELTYNKKNLLNPWFIVE